MVPIERIEGAILEIRGRKVMLDADLAALYGVTTKRLKEQVRRNAARFPDDFMFQLTWDEAASLRSQIVTSSSAGSLRSQNATLKRGQHIKYLPYAFTEHGAVMAAVVLNSQRAVEISVFVVRAFLRMRRMLADQRRFALKLDEIESRLGAYDQNFKVVFDAIRKLMEKPKLEPAPPRKIGFHVSDTVVPYGVGGKRKKR
jgi:phage regulator Rha-like protein